MGREERIPSSYSHHQHSTFGSALAAVDGGFGAPLGGEEADCLIDIKVEAEEVADYALVEVGAVGVGVGEVCGMRSGLRNFTTNIAACDNSIRGANALGVAKH